KFEAKKTIDATGKTVIPGFVDSHTHLVFAGAREFELEWKIQGMKYMEIAKRGGGINYTVSQTRSASKEALKVEAKKRLDAMLDCGTTTIEAKTGYGLNIEDEIKMLEVAKELSESHPMTIVPTYMGAHALAPEFKDFDGYTEFIVKKALPAIAKTKLAKYCDVFCEKGVFTPEQTRKILKAAKKLKFGIRIHADEIENTTGAEIATELNCASADHLLAVSDKGIKALASKKVMATLLPGAALALRTGKYAPARKLIDAGVPVALATDMNPNCWNENMQLVIALACYQMEMTPAEAIVASTINAAHSIGMADQIGSLEKGKCADIIILDAPNHKFLGYRFGGNIVETVIKDGKIVREKK
ncbi:MAG: imidazolonepropionase, partial [Candidatus Thermoplasmatota archaeon]|nr:imidazolonepropionase [Candidatus Thermoplasmatota archaeon]